MRWASAVSQFASLERAADEACALVEERLGGARPDLLAAFVSPHFEAAAEDIAARLRGAFDGALLFGCTAQSVIGGGREIEEGPCLALLGGELPGVSLRPFHWGGPGDGLETLPDAAGILLLADPFTTETDTLLRELDAQQPDAVTVGGMMSGTQAPGQGALYLDGATAGSGAIGVALSGNVRIETLVAQGCRPIGAPMFVTKGSANVISELDGRSPMDVVNELYAAADEHDQRLFRGSLFLGIEMESARSEYGHGDYLIRNLVGADEESGALHVANPVAERQVVQLHLRDAAAAAQDLEDRLAKLAAPDPRSAGALLFSCLGRGQGLYGVPDHDSEAFRRHAGEVPLAGFFGNGEIGPVGRQTFLHAYTSAFGVVAPAVSGLA